MVELWDVTSSRWKWSLLGSDKVQGLTMALVECLRPGKRSLLALRSFRQYRELSIRRVEYSTSLRGGQVLVKAVYIVSLSLLFFFPPPKSQNVVPPRRTQVSPRARGTWSQTLRTSLQAPKPETASPSAASCAIPIRTSQRPFHHLLQLSGAQFSASETRLCTLPSAHASFSARPPSPLPHPAPVPQPPDEAPLPRAPLFPSHAASAALSQ